MAAVENRKTPRHALSPSGADRTVHCGLRLPEKPVGHRVGRQPAFSSSILRSGSERFSRDATLSCSEALEQRCGGTLRRCDRNHCLGDRASGLAAGVLIRFRKLRLLRNRVPLRPCRPPPPAGEEISLMRSAGEGSEKGDSFADIFTASGVACSVSVRIAAFPAPAPGICVRQQCSCWRTSRRA